MTYIVGNYKYGQKTKAQIEAIPTTNLKIGDTVWNTDIKKEEYWTGNTWLNDDCVEMINNEGAAVSEGQIAGVDTDVTNTDYCELLNDTEDNLIMGVIYHGGNNGDWVTIACMGKYKVKFDSATSSVTRQHIAIISTDGGASDGEAGSAGAKTIASSGAIGVIAESHATMPGDKLVECWINGLEAY